MPRDDLAEVNPAAPAPAPWPDIDAGLIGAARVPLPPFPLHLLPPACRAWIEANARAFVPADYLAQGLLAATSALTGGGLYAVVSHAWAEPLVLWQALVGGPSTGKTPALMAARGLLARLELAPALHNDRALNRLIDDQHFKDLQGAVLWRDELASWLAAASDGAQRAGWLAGWDASAADAYLSSVDRFGLTVVGALRPERLAETLGDEELAARLLYAWPEATQCAPLAGPAADDEAVRALLKKIEPLVCAAEEPGQVDLAPEAVVALEQLLPALRQEMRETDGAEAAWIGKGAGTFVRLAGLLALLRWAASRAKKPECIDAAALMDAHALWAGYFLPHARAVFGRAGAVGRDRLARRAARWLQRTEAEQVSREDIRREALCQNVDADGAAMVIEQLETAGILRALAPRRSGSRGPSRWRWEIGRAHV